MKRTVPRVAAVHDLSCVGRCSLTVIMPVLAAMGIQACPLPTAVLSTHLGGFREVAFCDFTDRIASFYRHWLQEGVAFDCIYSGFLASAGQIDVVLEFIGEFSACHPLVLVDPVMGDEGRLYSVYEGDMQARMKSLVKRAHIITPNYTEAGFLLGETYRPVCPDPGQMAAWLRGLADMGPAQVVITGIPLGDGLLLTVAYDRLADRYCQTAVRQIPVRYPGTGDIFASVLAGILLRGGSLERAVEQAVNFVFHCVRQTYDAGTPIREGVLLEAALPQLLASGSDSTEQGGRVCRKNGTST